MECLSHSFTPRRTPIHASNPHPRNPILFVSFLEILSLPELGQKYVGLLHLIQRSQHFFLYGISLGEQMHNKYHHYRHRHQQYAALFYEVHVS